MKVPVLSSLILLLGVSSNLPAIERPKTLDENETKKQPAERQAEKVREPEAIPQVKPQGAGPWLGVLSEPTDETLGIHLGFKGGVTLTYVAKDSPAAQAGLAKHDVLTRIDGRGIANQEELREEIQGHQPGDKVKVSVVSKGQAGEREVTLGERPAELPPVPRAPRLQGNPKRPDLEGLQDQFPNLRDRMKDFERLFPKDGGDLQKQLDLQMKNLQEKLRELEAGGGLDLDLDEMLKELKGQKRGGLNFNFKSSGSFKFIDENGSVELKMTDGGKEVAVEDKNGKLLFEGPWDTPQDKAAAPEDIRERIEKMNLGNRMQFRMENLPKPEMELPDAKDEELE